MWGSPYLYQLVPCMPNVWTQSMCCTPFSQAADSQPEEVAAVAQQAAEVPHTPPLVALQSPAHRVPAGISWPMMQATLMAQEKHHTAREIEAQLWTGFYKLYAEFRADFRMKRAATHWRQAEQRRGEHHEEQVAEHEAQLKRLGIKVTPGA